MSAPVQPAYAQTVSVAARKVLDPLLNAKGPPAMPVMVMRAFAIRVQASIVKRRAQKDVVETKAMLGGVAGRFVTRTGVEAATARRLLINFHGGGFEIDSGSRLETLPLAGRCDAAIFATHYRMAPKHPFPAAVDDALAVYRAALAVRPAERIAIFGSSAGAILTIQLLARIKAESLPMPGAAGIFSGSGDLATDGDCEPYLPPILPGKTVKAVLSNYVGKADRNDPLLSPLRGDLSGLPPTLLLTSTRDQLLSHTVVLHRALRRAGVAAELEVYDGLPHCFWGWLDCPESDEAFDTMAAFFDRTLAP